jgi:hypothetical protein
MRKKEKKIWEREQATAQGDYGNIFYQSVF